MLLLQAVTRPVQAAENNPDKGAAIQSSLGVRYALDSNIYDSNADEVQSWIGIVTPAILFSAAEQRYTLRYEGEYGRFFEDSTDNYADHIASAAAQFHFGARGQLDFVAETEKGHRDRGSDQTEGIDPSSPFFPTEPDEFDRNKWGVKFRYGADGNRGRLRFGIGGSERDNTNNRERTRFFDYQTQYGNAGLSLLFHQRTAVVLDAVFTDIRYKNTRPGEASLDSEDWRYLVGLTWKATAKTVGSIRLGVQQRRFDDPALAKASNPSWEVDVRWSPREYSYFDFLSTRVNEETLTEGTFIDTTAYKVAWTHEWRGSWESIISWTERDVEFVGSEQDQTLSEVNLALRYRHGRLLTWEADYTRRSRDSGLDNLVYDGDMFGIGVNIRI